MTNRTRKLALTAHVISSVGWLGAVVAYLSLVVSVMTGQDVQTTSGAWTAMETIGWYAIVPLAIGAFLTGLVVSLGTTWGLFRHYWVVFKLLLTSFATVILLLHMPTVSLQAAGAEIGHAGLRSELVHAGGGLLVLLTTTVLAIYKPRGLTPYGKRKQKPLT